jgi:hypothetical protein
VKTSILVGIGTRLDRGGKHGAEHPGRRAASSFPGARQERARRLVARGSGCSETAVAGRALNSRAFADAEHRNGTRRRW